MISTVKHTLNSQKSSTPPLGIGVNWTTWLKGGIAVLGFCVWGEGFAWALMAYIYCYDIVRGVVRMALTFATLLGFIYFLFVHIL
jgi:hypothetical protein